jgi:short-subunit dehydrogenase
MFALLLMMTSVHSFPSTAALVAGSTHGIGVTMAKNLARDGYNVLVHGRDEKRIEQR